MMTKAAGAMDVVRIAGIDQDMKPVAVIDPGFAAPRQLCLALDLDVEKQPRIVPADADIGERYPFFKFAERGNTVFFG